MGNKLGRSTESKFTKSTGLYPTCEWDDKAVKKLINKKKIAPRYPGREDAGADMEECPICFLVLVSIPFQCLASLDGTECHTGFTSVVSGRLESFQVLPTTNMHR